MTDKPVVYIPTDRRFAMAHGRALPDRAYGAALFADISGFTPLTEALVRALGPQRGAEELTRQLDLVFDALIEQVDRYGGSVIAFSGDAITCWFDADDGRRAAGSGLEMQEAMRRFSSVPVPDGTTVNLQMKASIAAGPARRFLVGDPNIQVIDVLAGATLDRMAAGEHNARKGEVVLDEVAVTQLGELAELGDSRTDDHSGDRFYVVTGLRTIVPPTPWPPSLPSEIPKDQVRPWLLPPVWERANSEQGEFMAELRPAVALFLKFGGIDFDGTDAGERLDAYVRWAQAVLLKFEGYLLQVTVGDKGSYIYAPFGAPVAHGDDAIRAVASSLELRAPPAEFSHIGAVQIGISQGRMRTGPYGGHTRRTYGVLGDEVNLAARLMTASTPGQILVSHHARLATGDEFDWENLDPIQVKGKRDPITVHSLRGINSQRALLRHEIDQELPMIGRQAEVSRIESLIKTVLEGHGEVVGITGEAGMGKSRLVAEAIRLARAHRMLGYAGECQSYGTNNSYHGWHGIWRAFFEIEGVQSAEQALPILETQLREINPSFVARLPLLGPVLNLSFPDNDLTRSFDAKLRKSSLEGLLLDCLRARIFKHHPAGEAGTTPTLLLIEDAGWLDPLSADLLEVVARSIGDWPILILIAYRPPDPHSPSRPRLGELDNFTEITLGDLSKPEATELITAKLRQLLDDETPSPELIDRVVARAEGNPFYITELLNYMKDRGIDPSDPEALARVDLPTSLYSLMLSRIDQLTESQKTTLKVASIIGRLFRFAWLWGVYPQLGSPQLVAADLDATANLGLTAVDTPEPELIHLFRHMVTQEVAYESLVSDTRSLLHTQLARYVERTYASSLDTFIDLLAFHFERSRDDEKKKEYLRRAGDLAQSVYANSTAISYYERLLPLLAEAERVPVLLRLGQAYEITGKWDTAREQFENGIRIADRLNDRRAQAQSNRALGILLRKRGQRTDAALSLNRARSLFEALDDPDGISLTLNDLGEIRLLQGDYDSAQALYDSGYAQAGRVQKLEDRQRARAASLKGAGTVAAQRGHFEHARELYEEGLALLRDLGDKPGVANSLNNLGIVARYMRDLDSARRLQEEGLAIRRELGDRWAIAMSLGNLGNVTMDQGDNARARDLHEEALAISRQLGAKKSVANALNNLGNAIRALGDFDRARAVYDESLRINVELGDKWDIAYLLEDLGCLASAEGEAVTAMHLVGAAAAVREALGAPLSAAEKERLDRNLIAARNVLGLEESQARWAEGHAMELDKAVEYALGRTHSPIPNTPT